MGIVRPAPAVETAVTEIKQEIKALQSPRVEGGLALTPATSTNSDASPKGQIAKKKRKETDDPLFTMDSSDEDNDFNEEFFDDLRLHNEADHMRPQIVGELPEVAQKYAVCELQPSLDIPEVS